ncbi:MAG: right-handed parallel beta-helix repeat-containing protein [Armatimonadota bacterium]|nr:right-handed parallel beta-helix repeat-containing protein [Armatimonadota bacterium]MCX7777043.1 right-handed parallel beta-helix repeat-containing protein [Armatimonadota bacterium]MDW8024889.1 right-handed parallel beta-helix repeat-containing protein [Armatimonadota bacterium]
MALTDETRETLRPILQPMRFMWALSYLIAILICISACSRLCAATIVVDQHHRNASDDNLGTEESPLRTINRAAQIAKAGDTVVVKAGIYRESIRLRNDGEPGAPITFRAQPIGSVVISGADVVKGWQRVDGDEPIYRIPWERKFIINWRKDGTPVEHHPEDAPLWGRAELVLVDGKMALPSPDIDSLRKAWRRYQEDLRSGKESSVLSPPMRGVGIKFAGMFAVDGKAKALYLWLANGSNPNEHQVEVATRSELFGTNPWANPKGHRYINVRGFVFRHAATFPQRAAIWLHGENNLVEDCIIEEMSGSGILVHGTMRRCIIRRCGHTGGGASGRGFLNEDCLWEENCWKPISRGWDAGGFKLAWANGGIFRRCLFRRNGGPGLWLDIHVRNVVITECVFMENEKSGLFIEISRDITVTRNLFLRNAIGIVGEVEFPDWSTAGIQIAESQNCIVAFNTCVGNKDGIAMREQGPRKLTTEDFGEVSYHNSGNIIVGNICAFNRGYQLALWYDNAFFGWHPAERKKFVTEKAFDEFVSANPNLVFDPTKQGMLIDRNLYFATDGQKLFLYGVPWRPKHRLFDDLKGFADFTGFDAHSEFADPRFMDASKDVYQVSSDSPALKMQVGWLRPPTNIEEWLKERLGVLSKFR